MNIEGTKHEKAVLVIVAYIIGLTTGLIGFGLSAALSKDTTVSVADSRPTAPAVIEGYTPPTDHPPADNDVPAASEAEAEPPAGESAFYDDGKLFAMVGDERFVLSLHTDVAPKDNVEGFATQGIHQNLPAYAASDDGAYIYFCEQQTAADECTHFVFDAKAAMIQFVSVDGEKLVTNNAVAKTAQFAGHTLMIKGYESVDVDTPWKVAAVE